MNKTCWIVAACVCSTVGCGSGGPYELVRASGTIKYADGSLIPGDRIELRFISEQPPIDPKTHPRVGVAEVNMADGTFVVSTYDYEDGLIVGRHKILAASMSFRGGYTPQIPQKYRDKDATPLEVDAAASPFEILIEKP